MSDEPEQYQCAGCWCYAELGTEGMWIDDDFFCHHCQVARALGPPQFSGCSEVGDDAATIVCGVCGYESVFDEQNGHWAMLSPSAPWRGCICCCPPPAFPSLWEEALEYVNDEWDVAWTVQGRGCPELDLACVTCGNTAYPVQGPGFNVRTLLEQLS